MNEALLHKSRKPDISLDALETPRKELSESDDMNGNARDRANYALKLQKALHTMPAVYRRLLVDHFVRELPVKRIARRNRIPVGTVLSRIFRAKRLLPAAWQVVT